MRQSWFSVATFLMFTATLAVGCDDDGDGVPGGTGGGGGTGTGGTATGGGGAGGSGTGGTGTGGNEGGGGSGGTTGDCTYNGFSVVEDHVRDATPVATIYVAEGDADAPMDLLVIQSWHSEGAPTGAYEHTFTGENFSTCHTCAVVGRGCPNPTGAGTSLEYDLPACNQVFLVTAGELSVNGTGSAYAGTLTGATAVEVTVDWNGDFTSTPVVDGEDWCLPSFTFPM